MGVGVKPFQKLLDVLGYRSVPGDASRPCRRLDGGRKVAVNQQVGRLQIRTLFGKLFDGIAAVAQDSLIAVDKRHGAPARSGVHERGVVGHQAEVIRPGLDLTEVEGPDRVVFDREFILLTGAVVNDRQRTLGAWAGCFAPGAGRLHGASPGGLRWIF